MEEGTHEIQEETTQEEVVQEESEKEEVVQDKAEQEEVVQEKGEQEESEQDEHTENISSMRSICRSFLRHSFCLRFRGSIPRRFCNPGRFRRIHRGFRCCNAGQFRRSHRRDDRDGTFAKDFPGDFSIRRFRNFRVSRSKCSMFFNCEIVFGHLYFSIFFFNYSIIYSKLIFIICTNYFLNSNEVEKENTVITLIFTVT